MRKYSIVLLSAIAALIVIVLAVPLCMGFWVQSRYPDILARFNTPHATFHLVSFDRGWFHSRAQLEVTLHYAETTLSGEPIPLAQFTIEQNIQHGPILFLRKEDGSRRWFIARAAMQNEHREDNLNFNADVLWTMSNSLDTRLNVRHILLGNERQRIEINQLTGNINFTPSSHHFQSNVTLSSGFLYEKNPDQVGTGIIDLVKVMEVHDFRTGLDIRKIKTLWMGTRHFEAEKVVFFPDVKSAVTVDNWSIDLNESQHNGLTDLNFANQIGLFAGNDLKISQVQIAFALKDMNTQLLEDIVHVFMYGGDFQRFKLYSLLADLFTKGMTIDLTQFRFTTDDGPVSLEAKISSPSVEEGATLSFVHLLEKMNVQAIADMPRTWLQKNLIAYFDGKNRENPHLKIDPQAVSQRYVDYWVEHRMLIPEDHQLTVAIVYENGDLTINGEKPALNNLIISDVKH